MYWLDRFVHNPLALNAKQVAYLLQKSRRWVYRNGISLGGVKVGRTWFFPKEGFYNAIQGQGNREVEGRGQTQRAPYRPEDVQNKEGGVRLGKRGSERAEKERLKESAARHGLADLVR
jgi:hypothetical protein